MESNLCIIPARGGSKRIPRKNIRPFLGKPIIAYSIEAARQSGLFDEVMVSTDDPEIAAIAKSFGAEVPFIRSYRTSDDFSTTADVLNEVLQEYAKADRHFDKVCCCYATAPFVSSDRLIEGYTALDEETESVFPIVEFGFPILRSLKLKDGGLVELNWPENLNARSQDLPKSYHDAGQWYWLKTKAYREKGKLIMDRTKGIELNELEVQDIDSETDWKLAEIKYEILQKTK